MLIQISISLQFIVQAEILEPKCLVINQFSKSKLISHKNMMPVPTHTVSTV